jgi:hypothetical protein
MRLAARRAMLFQTIDTGVLATITGGATESEILQSADSCFRQARRNFGTYLSVMDRIQAEKRQADDIVACGKNAINKF